MKAPYGVPARLSRSGKGVFRYSAHKSSTSDGTGVTAAACYGIVLVYSKLLGGELVRHSRRNRGGAWFWNALCGVMRQHRSWREREHLFVPALKRACCFVRCVEVFRMPESRAACR